MVESPKGFPRALVYAALALAGCDGGDGPPPAAAAEPGGLLVDRGWTSANTEALPGVLRVFLSDGTLLQDSCWETHRLSRWAWDVAGSTLHWNEDGAEIRASVVELTERSLVLRLELVGGSEEQRYVAAPVPYVCPDMPR